jgi:hypothetical protein
MTPRTGTCMAYPSSVTGMLDITICGWFGHTALWSKRGIIVHRSLKDGSNASLPTLTKHDIGGRECPFLDARGRPPSCTTLSFSCCSHFCIGQLMTILQIHAPRPEIINMYQFVNESRLNGFRVHQ